MTERREILGQWWFPAQPEEKWIGTLVLEPGQSPFLTLTVPRPMFLWSELQAPAVIHGHDEHGKPITILFPGWPSSSSGMAMSRVTFHAGYAVIGIVLESPNEFCLNRLALELQHLYEWTGITGLSTPNHTFDQTVISYRRPENQSFSIGPHLTLEFHATHGFSTERTSQSVHEDVSLSFHSDQGIDLRSYRRLLNALRRMLHFATLKPVYPLAVTGVRDGHGRTVEGRFYPSDIELFSSIVRQPAESDPRWVFKFSDIQPGFAQFFADWLEFCDTYSEPLSCYSSVVYHSLPESVQHLCLAQALEAFHARKCGQASFVDRVQALTAPHLAHLSGLVHDAGAFAKQVRDNRNYYTHHDPSIQGRGRVLSGSQLLRLNEKMRLLFQMCILTEMGIAQERFALLRRQIARDTIDYP